MLFGTWLRSVRAKEREAGVNHRELACRPALLSTHVQDHLSHALHTMEKLYIRIPPSPITEARLRERWEEFRPEYVRELRDALDHIGAALTAVGCTEEELASIGQHEEGEKDEADKAEVQEEKEEAPETPGPDGGHMTDETVVLSLSDALSTVGHETEK